MNYSLSFTCNNTPWLNHSNMGLFNKRDLKYLELSPAPQSSSWKQIVLCREKLLWSMCSMVCTVCQIKADTTKENCFRWTVRPDFTCSLTAVTQGSSVVMLSCVGRGVMVRAAWEWGLRRRDMLLPKYIFLFSCEWEMKLFPDQLLTSGFRAGITEVQASITLWVVQIPCHFEKPFIWRS